MPIIEIKDDEHWHELRRNRIGASDIAGLFNCGNSWTPTVNELYHMMRGNLPRNRSAGVLAALGKAMEPFIAFAISDIHGWRLEPCKRYHIHPEHDHLGCTLDYDVVESEHGPGILQIKNVQQFAPGWSQNRAPDHVELQHQQEFLVTNEARIAKGLKPFAWGAIGAMFAGNPEDIRVMLRSPDPKVHKHIIERSSKFMQDVRDMKEPPLLGSEDYAHVAELFKATEVVEEEVKDLRGDAIMDDWVAQFHKAKAEIKHHEQVADEMKARIIHRLLTEKADGMVKAISGRTDLYTIGVKQIEVNYKAKPASTGVQLRFKAEAIDTSV